MYLRMGEREEQGFQYQTYSAFWADEGGHILHNSKHFDSSFLAEVNFLADIKKGNLLRGGDYNCTSQTSLTQVLNCR
jgi:hypothetical protein